MICLMRPRQPRFQPSDPRRARDARETFRDAVRDAMLQAVAAGWREAEAALAFADAADDYIMFLAERPRQYHVAANSN
jgi:hypothetical protein